MSVHLISKAYFKNKTILINFFWFVLCQMLSSNLNMVDCLLYLKWLLWLNKKELFQWLLEPLHLSPAGPFLKLEKLLVHLPCNQTTVICHLVSKVAVFFMPRTQPVSFSVRKEILAFSSIFSPWFSLEGWVIYAHVLMDAIVPELIPCV